MQEAHLVCPSREHSPAEIIAQKNTSGQAFSVRVQIVNILHLRAIRFVPQLLTSASVVQKQPQTMHKSAWWRSNKTLLTKTAGGLQFANPLYRSTNAGSIQEMKLY